MQRRRNCLSGGPWQRVLRVLVLHGESDLHIALCLSNLSDAALAALARWPGQLTDTAVHALEEPGAGRPWTRLRVFYHRRRLGLSNRHRLGLSRLAAVAARLRQARRGWGHLGVGLGRRELDLLDALRDAGPLSRPELSRRLRTPGRRTPSPFLGSRGYSGLARLLRAGLVVRLPGPGWVLTLAEDVRPSSPAPAPENALRKLFASTYQS